MKFNLKLLAAVMAVGLSASLLSAADETPAPASQPTKSVKLTKPYSELKDLTDDQKEKIAKAHADFLDKEKQIKAEEKAAIDAVLTDEQKAEIKAASKAAKSDKKKEKEKDTATEAPKAD